MSNTDEQFKKAINESKRMYKSVVEPVGDAFEKAFDPIQKTFGIPDSKQRREAATKQKGRERQQRLLAMQQKAELAELEGEQSERIAMAKSKRYGRSLLTSSGAAGFKNTLG